MSPSLTSPTLVASINARTAFVYRSSDNRSRIDELLGLALACLTRQLKPFLLLSLTADFHSSPRGLAHSCPHNSLISFFHAEHSLKRYSLLCLPLPHHQHTSVPIHPHLSLRKGTIIACPFKSWKKIVATPAERGSDSWPGTCRG